MNSLDLGEALWWIQAVPPREWYGTVPAGLRRREARRPTCFGDGYEFNPFPRSKACSRERPGPNRRAEAQIAALGASERMREFET